MNKFFQDITSSRLSVLVLVAALLASVAVILWLGTRLRASYADALIAQIWPTRAPAAIRSAPWQSDHRTVLLLGDSRVAEWGAPSLPGFNAVNAGVGGATTAQVAEYCEKMLQSTETKPQVIVVQAGINDLKVLGVRPDLRSAVIAQVISNLTGVVGQARRANARVILTPIWPASRPDLLRRAVWGPEIESARLEVNSRLSGLSGSDSNVLWVDLFAQLTNDLAAASQKVYYRDTLHLRPEMYQHLSRLLREPLERAVRAGSDEPGR